ncbi:MAG TPA: hypothetical protein DCS93_42630 [Microscillaceae bacterium]|nr:hypothetical protein [Microscillaceae bacterium]
MPILERLSWLYGQPLYLLDHLYGTSHIDTFQPLIYHRQQAASLLAKAILHTNHLKVDALRQLYALKNSGVCQSDKDYQAERTYFMNHSAFKDIVLEAKDDEYKFQKIYDIIIRKLDAVTPKVPGQHVYYSAHLFPTRFLKFERFAAKVRKWKTENY